MTKSFKTIPFLVLFLLQSSAAATERGTDPFLAVEHIKFPNGLQVFLAPSDETPTTAIRLEVGVGWGDEDKKNLGVSHLLEHVLFRDKELKDEMSYLQLIREAGGSANGSTEKRRTSYFGSIPSTKGAWLLENVGKMILEPKFLPEYVTKEKGTIELERGRPNPITLFLGFNPKDLLYPKHLNSKSFWETEFNISYDEPFTLTEEQLSTRRLQLSDVQRHYEDYYHPANMKLYIAGKYKKEEILKIISQKWASLPHASHGKTSAPEKKPAPRQQPYVRQVVYNDNPYVYLGTKIWDVSIREEEVLQSYMEYLAHRLMKEIRNMKGQTYSAHAETSTHQGFGTSMISFQTTKENLEENLKIAKDYIYEEATQGKLTESQVKEAVDLMLSKYQLMSRDSANMMWLATEYSQIIEDEGKFVSPFEALNTVSADEYNQTLVKYFSPERRYEYLYRPNLFFYSDNFIWAALAAIFSFMGLRRLLTKKFEHTQIRWVRKVTFPPMKLLEGILLLVGWYVYAHFHHFAENILFNITFLQTNFFLSQYALPTLWVFSMIAVAQGILSITPRKLMVVGQDLMFKSVSYYSFCIPVSEIKSVKTLHCWAYPFPLGIFLGKVRHRFYYFNFKLWQKGLLIERNDGRMYYLSITSADKACEELNTFIQAKAKSQFAESGLETGQKAA